jgi:hypothetical protein
MLWHEEEEVSEEEAAVMMEAAQVLVASIEGMVVVMELVKDQHARYVRRWATMLEGAGNALTVSSS